MFKEQNETASQEIKESMRMRENKEIIKKEPSQNSQVEKCNNLDLKFTGGAHKQI